MSLNETTEQKLSRTPRPAHRRTAPLSLISGRAARSSLFLTSLQSLRPGGHMHTVGLLFLFISLFTCLNVITLGEDENTPEISPNVAEMGQEIFRNLRGEFTYVN